jgi:hypothetical protein
MKCSWSVAGKIECFENENENENNTNTATTTIATTTKKVSSIKEKIISDTVYMKVVYAFIATMGLLCILMLFALVWDNLRSASVQTSYNPALPTYAYKA